MRIEIRGNAFKVSQSLRQYIERRLWFALGRFANRLAPVTVRIADLNGPRGGVDKQCRVCVRLQGLENIVIEETAAKVYTAVDGAAERAGRAVARALKRRSDDGRANASYGKRLVNSGEPPGDGEDPSQLRVSRGGPAATEDTPDVPGPQGG